MKFQLFSLLLSTAFLPDGRAFTPTILGRIRPNCSFQLFSSTSGADISSLRVAEIKSELESYGISTKSFLEKSELVDALIQARADGLKPKSRKKKKKSRSSVSEPESGSVSSSSSTSSSDSKPREERLKEEMESCGKMRAGELKKELEERGISTKSFFEKSEFVKALAEARVDGVENKPEESYAEYTNVEVLTDDDAGPRKKQDPQAQQQQQGGGSPFGGANPFGGGGMGGMGGMEDLLKNMGGMGGMGGGAGGMGGMEDILKNMGGMGGGAGGE